MYKQQTRVVDVLQSLKNQYMIKYQCGEERARSVLAEIIDRYKFNTKPLRVNIKISRFVGPYHKLYHGGSPGNYFSHVTICKVVPTNNVNIMHYDLLKYAERYIK